MEKTLKRIPDSITYKRGNIFLIMLAYLCAFFVGVNFAHTLTDMYLMYHDALSAGWVIRLIHAATFLMSYGVIKWSLHYMYGKAFTPDTDGIGMYEHHKYDSFTRVNGFLVLTVYAVTTVYVCWAQT